MNERERIEEWEFIYDYGKDRGGRPGTNSQSQQGNMPNGINPPQGFGQQGGGFGQQGTGGFGQQGGGFGQQGGGFGQQGGGFGQQPQAPGGRGRTRN